MAGQDTCPISCPGASGPRKGLQGLQSQVTGQVRVSKTLMETRGFGILAKRKKITTPEKLEWQFLLKLQVLCGRPLVSSGSCLLMRLVLDRPR